MKRALEQLAQGKRGGLYLVYARFHTLKCPQCQAALHALKQYFRHLSKPGLNVEIDVDRLRKGLKSIDSE
jgi:hypothetical protein